MKWKKLPFKNLYAIPSKNGLTRPKRVRGNGFKMINMGELFAHDRIENIDMELVPMNEKELSNMLVEEGDLLFARQSLVLSGAGKCSIVIRTSEPTTFESHIIRVRLNKKIADPEFYFYYFKSPTCAIRSIVTQGVQAGIRGNDLKVLPVHLPPINIQNKIVGIINKYDKLIANNHRRIKLLEKSAQLLYKEWFIHLRYPDHNHLVMIDNFPKKWAKKKLFNIAHITMGQSPKSEFYNENNNGFPFHQGVKNYGFRFVENATYCTQPTRLAAAGDILCSVRAPVGRINITLDEMILGRGLSSIRSKDGFQSYLFYCLKNYFFKEDMIGNGAIYASVTKKDMENIELRYPNKTLIKHFEKISKPIDEQIANLTIQNRQLSQARDLLLPRLMNGEIKV